MILRSWGDVAFELFGFPVYYYGIILAASCFLAVYVAKFLYEKIYADQKSELIWDISPYVVILGILGARLYYCLLNFSFYFNNPIKILDIREGGLSIHGGIIAGILTLFFMAKKYNFSILRLLDVFSVGTVLAQSVGRWGNFFNNEAFGLPSDLFIKLYIPLSHRPQGFENYEYFHPTFLYESVLDFCIFIILLFILKRYGYKIEGLTLCSYLLMYSIVRFFVEGLRVDSALTIFNVHIAQIVSFIVCVISLIFMGVIIARYLKKVS